MRNRLARERGAKGRHVFKNTCQWGMRRDKCRDAQKEIACVAEFGLSPKRFLSAPKGRVARAGNRCHEHLVRGKFTRMDQPNVSLNEQCISMRSLPDICVARLDLDTCHKTKVGMRTYCSRERAAAGKYLQRPPWRARAARRPMANARTDGVTSMSPTEPATFTSSHFISGARSARFTTSIIGRNPPAARRFAT